MAATTGLSRLVGAWLRKRLLVPDNLPDQGISVLAVVVVPFGLHHGTLGPKTAAVVERAVELCRQYHAVNVIAMGGWQSVGQREGPLIAAALKGQVPDSTSVVVEDATRNTFEQARYLRNIVPTLNGCPSVAIIVVADELHAQRVALLATRHLRGLAKVHRASTRANDWENDKLALTNPIIFGFRELVLLVISRLIWCL